MSTMTIGQYAAAGAVGVETVRFYQRKGLLRVPASAGAVRTYDATDVDQLRFIRAAQRAGFRLSEIAELLGLDRVADRARIRTLAEQRINKLDEEIALLAAARQALLRLAQDCADGGSGPCPIIAAFN